MRSSPCSKASCTPARRATTTFGPTTIKATRTPSRASPCSRRTIRSRCTIPSASSRCRSAASRRRPAIPRVSRRRRTSGSTRPGRGSCSGHSLLSGVGAGARAAMKHLPGHRPPPRSSRPTATPPAPALVIRMFVVATLVAWLLVAFPARAGHEMPFYPSYYPQEITVEALPATVAAARLEKNTLHAFIGGDPFAGRALPSKLAGVESLGSYVVVTMNTTTAALATPDARCPAARAIIAGLDGAGWRPHPYPVTPYHSDHLAHVDLIDAAATAQPRTPGARAASRLRVRPRGALAERLVGGRGGAGAWEALVEEVSGRDLVRANTTTLNGGSAPPWIKDGWFHAWLLNPTPSAQDLVQRLMAGGGEGTAGALEPGGAP